MKNIRSLAAQGFTLIELVIAVAIIGILAGIGVPALNQSRNNAVNAKIAALQTRVAIAKTRYAIEQGVANSAFDALTEANKFTSVAPYLLVNGVAPDSLNTLLNNIPGAPALNIGNTTTAPSITGQVY
jgi:type IV pilus assembly protein PilE